MDECRKTRRQALTEFREGEILHAARKVFSERGFAETTMDAIAAEAGIAKGTLYLYFESKEEIFWKSILVRFQEMLEQTKLEVERIEGVEAKLRALVRVRFAFMRSNEAFLRMYFFEFGTMNRNHGPHHGAFRAAYLEAARYVAAILEVGMHGGEVRRENPLAAAITLLDQIKNVFALRLLYPEDFPPEFDGESFVFNLFWRGIARESESRKMA